MLGALLLLAATEPALAIAPIGPCEGGDVSSTEAADACFELVDEEGSDVAEPAAMAMFGLGLTAVGVVGWRWRSRRRRRRRRRR